MTRRKIERDLNHQLARAKGQKVKAARVEIAVVTHKPLAPKKIVKTTEAIAKERVDNAIALLRARKREQHIPNPAGYFTSVLKGGKVFKCLYI